MITKIPCAIIRGGTSKGVYLLDKDLPADPEARSAAILKIFGSPDKRQIDGLGGADALTSKVAIIKAADNDDYDIIYTYGQVAIDQPQVFFRGICGNISAGVGPFAIDQGLVPPVEPVTQVRVFNTNTQKVFIAKVPVKDGRAEVSGEYRIDGVPGTGARIRLDFSATAGAITGKLLPTGQVRDLIQVDGYGPMEVSIVDCSVLEVYVKAETLGMSGVETPAEIDGNNELLKKCELLRGTVACMMGLASSPRQAVAESANIPHLVVVGPARDFTSYLDQKKISAADIDFTARMLFMQKTHKTYAGTGSICTSVAAMIPGSVVNEYVGAQAIAEHRIRIGHPGGIVEVDVDVAKRDDSYHVNFVEVSRTARRIMDGMVYIND